VLLILTVLLEVVFFPTKSLHLYFFLAVCPFLVLAHCYSVAAVILVFIRSRSHTTLFPSFPWVETGIPHPFNFVSFLFVFSEVWAGVRSLRRFLTHCCRDCRLSYPRVFALTLRFRMYGIVIFLETHSFSLCVQGLEHPFLHACLDTGCGT